MIPFDINLQLKLFISILKDSSLRKKGLIRVWFVGGVLGFLLSTSIQILSYLVNNVFFIIDEFLFFRYSKISTQDSIFIIGPPRSGTTYLHRLLANHDELSAMKYWEINFAPAISQKYLLLLAGVIDRKLGSPAYRYLNKKVDQSLFEFNKIHKSGLFEYEEDCGLFQHSGNSPYSICFFSYPVIKRLFIHFDKTTTMRYQNRYMKHYNRCIQKHLYVFGPDKTYLSKSPTFSSYVIALQNHFNQAKFIYIYRNPNEVVPSALSLFQTLGIGISTNERRDFIIHALQEYYSHPLYSIDFSQTSNTLMQYTDLISALELTLNTLLKTLDLDLTNDFEKTLNTESQKEKYQSKNHYTLAQHGLTESKVKKDFSDIFKQFESRKEGTSVSENADKEKAEII